LPRRVLHRNPEMFGGAGVDDCSGTMTLRSSERRRLFIRTYYMNRRCFGPATVGGANAGQYDARPPPITHRAPLGFVTAAAARANGASGPPICE